MYKTVHFDGKKLIKDMQTYLKKHDITYQSPVYEGYDGLYTGNGDIGCMTWHNEREAVIALNKCDVIDSREEGRFGAWSWEEEERNTALVSCARIRLTDGQPSFDKLFLSDYEAVLQLSDGKIKTFSKTPFSEWQFEIFASSAYNSMIVDIQASSEEEIERNITVERWGSRNFFHYYEQYVADPSLKISGTRSGEQDGCIYLEQSLRGSRFVVCAKLVGETYRTDIRNSRDAGLIIPKSKTIKASLIVTVVCGNEHEDLLEQAIRQVNKCAEDLPLVRKMHVTEWSAFWEKSFVRIDDDYLENLYYLYLFQMNASSKGKLPALFNGSLWTWNHDTRNWGHLYHWNQQQQYWGMHAANHSELVDNYLDFRWNMLNNAKQDALEVFGYNGAFFSDICSLNGYQAMEPDTVRNYTVGPQIAMDFYRHYLYSGDIEFLRTKAYSFIKECIRFYMNMVYKEDGRYAIHGGTVYESYWNVKNTITDRAMMEVLFRAGCDSADLLGVDSDEAQQWRNIADGLYEVPTTVLDTEAGNKKVLSSGLKWDDTPIGLFEGVYPLSPFKSGLFCPIYPATLTGISDQDSEFFAIAVETVRQFLDKKVYADREGGNGHDGWWGHTPLPLVAARLGMAEDVVHILDLYIKQFQCFPNGLMHYANIREQRASQIQIYLARQLTGHETSTDWAQMHEKQFGKRISYHKNQFLHGYNEAGGIMFASVNEMLLQSHDGVIRVFPAFPFDRSAAFTLLAVGNFLVTSEICDEAVMYISIISQIGGLCRIQVPWKEPFEILVNGQSTKAYNVHSGVLILETSPEDIVTLQRREFPLSIFYQSPLGASIHRDVKRKGCAMLGKERDF